MLILKRFLTLFIFMIFLIVGLGGTAMGQDHTLKDLNDYSCKDVMRMSGGDRDVRSASFMPFYWGKKALPRLTSKSLPKPPTNSLNIAWITRRTRPSKLWKK